MDLRHAQNVQHADLINGQLGRRIYHARGLRQGDLLSLLLFIIIIEKGSEEELGEVLEAFPCRVEGLPTKYLSVLEVKRLGHDKEQVLIDSVAARLPTWKAGLLNAAGRRTLTRKTPLNNPGTCLHLLHALRVGDQRHRQDQVRLPLGRHRGRHGGETVRLHGC